MRKIFKSCTFWFLLLGLFIIYMHQIGQDSFSIVLFGVNPILAAFADSKIGSMIMDSGVQIQCNTVAGSISVYWYIGTMITFFLYGGIIDFIRVKRKLKQSI